MAFYCEFFDEIMYQGEIYPNMLKLWYAANKKAKLSSAFSRNLTMT